MQSKTARTMQGSVNLANLGLLKFRLVREMGAGHPILIFVMQKRLKIAQKNYLNK
jgi:hypothetical protein